MLRHVCCDELRVRYLLALEEVRTARQELAFSATLTRMASAASRLAHVEEHKEQARQELVSHCARPHSTLRAA